MSTATVSRTDALEKVRELQQEAANLEVQFNQEMDAILKQIAQEMDTILKQIAQEASLSQTNDAQPARRGRPPASLSQTNNAQPARRGRPPASERSFDPENSSPVARNSKVAPDQRNYSNQMSLKRAIWDVLDRPSDWAQLLSDLPNDALGLQISEIKEIIEFEKKWVSSSADISTQLSSHLHNLKKTGLLGRTADTFRYYIIEGAELISGKRGRKAA